MKMKEITKDCNAKQRTRTHRTPNNRDNIVSSSYTDTETMKRFSFSSLSRTSRARSVCSAYELSEKKTCAQRVSVLSMSEKKMKNKKTKNEAKKKLTKNGESACLCPAAVHSQPALTQNSSMNPMEEWHRIKMHVRSFILQLNECRRFEFFSLLRTSRWCVCVALWATGFLVQDQLRLEMIAARL